MSQPMIDPERDLFMRMSMTFLSASFHGVHKTIPIEQVMRRACQLADKLWQALLLSKPQMTKDEWNSVKSDAAAYMANMSAHNHDLHDDQLIRDGIDCAKLKWQTYQEWREKQ